jgi:formylglycine-generating enzyme required for sulfatase activity
VVGQLRPNQFGLHDLLGNVAEWCQDGWNPTYYAQFQHETAVDPTGPTADFFFRSIRGGSWWHRELNCRSAARKAGGPNLYRNHIGLRVALPVESVQGLLRAQKEQAAQQPPEQPLGPVPRGPPI